MPVHDWTRVEAGTFHAFHNAWITHLMEALNGGLLPEGFYALAERHAGQLVADVLTLHPPEPSPDQGPGGGGVAVAEAPPRVGRKLVLSPEATYRLARRTLTIRHTSGHRVVALLEIASPGNKDRPASVEQFVDKAESALLAGCHVLVVDLWPPGPHDPDGLPGAIWSRYDPQGDPLPAGRPLSLASFVAVRPPEAYVEHLAFGDPLPEMPLFLTPDLYVNVPLEPTYQSAYRGMPAFWRSVLEAS